MPIVLNCRHFFCFQIFIIFLPKIKKIMSKISVILSTYNQPKWLEKVLWGYEMQTEKDFEVVIADDGSNDETKNLIDDIAKKASYKIIHVWHEDNGFRKCAILNKAIEASATDYLLFSDGDCIPRSDFVSVHLEKRKPNYFLSGGYFKLPMNISEVVDIDDIREGRCFDIKWLKSHGLKSSFKNNKLTAKGIKSKILNSLTPTKATWNGQNSSGWKSDIVAANGFDERMAYGGEDRELGERLMNKGIRGTQIRYSAICIHLDHKRGYVTDEAWKQNNDIRSETKKNKSIRTDFGIKTQL